MVLVSRTLTIEGRSSGILDKESAYSRCLVAVDACGLRHVLAFAAPGFRRHGLVSAMGSVLHGQFLVWKCHAVAMANGRIHRYCSDHF